MYLFIHRQRPPPNLSLSESEIFIKFHMQMRPPFISPERRPFVFHEFMHKRHLVAMIKI